MARAKYKCKNCGCRTETDSEPNKTGCLKGGILLRHDWRVVNFFSDLLS